MQTKINEFLNETTKEYFQTPSHNGAPTMLKEKLNAGLWTILSRDFNQKFGQSIPTYKPNGEHDWQTRLDTAKMHKGKLDIDIKEGLTSGIKTEEFYRGLVRKQDAVKAYEAQIAFFENAIKIHDTVNNYATQVDTLARDENFTNNRSKQEGIINDEHNQNIRANTIMAAKATGLICASYALMLGAAAAFMIAITPLLIVPMLLAAGSATVATPATAIASGVAAYLLYSGSEILDSYSKGYHKIDVEANHKFSEDRMYEFLTSDTISPLTENVANIDDIVKEIKEHAKTITDAAKEITSPQKTASR